MLTIILSQILRKFMKNFKIKLICVKKGIMSKNR